MSIISISSTLRKGIDLTDLERLSSRELDSFHHDDYLADQNGGHNDLIIPSWDMDSLDNADAGWFSEEDGVDDDCGTDTDSDGEQDDDYDWFDPADPDSRLNPMKGVQSWEILAVGSRPKDFLARDCLFGSLFRDYRATWFHRYMRKPQPWMEALVAHLPPKSRRQALQCVVLDYLHKLHLARLTNDNFAEDGPDFEYLGLLLRLWRCPPYGVLCRKKDPQLNMPHPCGMPRLCPWCYARKVTELSECLRTRLFKNPAGKYLVLGSASPLMEPFGGLDGRWEDNDMYARTHQGSIREHCGRYYGQWRDRTLFTRDVLAKSLRSRDEFSGPKNGFWVHQIGSGQSESGLRSFLHKLAIVGELTQVEVDQLKANPGWEFSDDGRSGSLHDWGDYFPIRWTVLPADHPSALRILLAGSSHNYRVSHLGLDASRFCNHAGHPKGIVGAFSWQPTFLLDDYMWFKYVEVIKGQRLYHPFGSWKPTISRWMTKTHGSVDRRFSKLRPVLQQRSRQQAGNRKRQQRVTQRRQELLRIAEPLWPDVVKEAKGSRGRPPYRAVLEKKLNDCVCVPSARDLNWLVKCLRAGVSGVSQK